MVKLYDPQALQPIYQKQHQARVQKHKEAMDTAPRKFLSALSEGAGNQFAVAMGKLATDATRFEFFGGKEDLDLKLEKGVREQQKGRRDQKTFDVIQPRERKQKLADKEINDLRRMQPESMSPDQLKRAYKNKAQNILNIEDPKIRDRALNDLMSMSAQHEGMAGYLQSIAKTKYGYSMTKNPDGTYTVKTSSPPRSVPMSAAEKKRLLNTANRLGAELLEMIESGATPEAIAAQRKKFEGANRIALRKTGDNVKYDTEGNPLPNQQNMGGSAPRAQTVRKTKESRKQQESRVFADAGRIITVEGMGDTDTVESRFDKVSGYKDLSPALKAQVANAVKTGSYVAVTDPLAVEAVTKYAYKYHKDAINSKFSQTSESQEVSYDINQLKLSGYDLSALGDGITRAAINRILAMTGGSEAFNTKVADQRMQRYILTGVK